MLQPTGGTLFSNDKNLVAPIGFGTLWCHLLHCHFGAVYQLIPNHSLKVNLVLYLLDCMGIF